MSGIVACILKNGNVSPILFDCISKLEYRGYDSMGMACYDNDKIDIRKGKGTISELNEEYDFQNIVGKCGIAHLRWASQGKPSNINSHPHFNKDKSIAIVHNGIIENYLPLKEELESDGYEFISNCDSEIIPHLLDKFIKQGHNLEHAMMKVSNYIEGSYAIVAMCTYEPCKLVAITKESPLYISPDNEKSFITSDIPSIIHHNKKIIKLEFGEIAIITNENVKFLNDENEIIDKSNAVINLPNITLDETDETERLIENQKDNHEEYLRKNLNEIENIEEIISCLKGKINRIILVPTKSLYSLARNVKYFFESKKCIPISFDYENFDESSLFIFMHQGNFEKRKLERNEDSINEIFDKVRDISKTMGICQDSDTYISQNADYYIQFTSPLSFFKIPYTSYFNNIILILIVIALLNNDTNLTNELKEVPNYIDELYDIKGFKYFYEKYEQIDFYSILFDFIIIRLMD